MISLDKNNNAQTYARWLFSGPCQFIIGAKNIQQIPPTDLPEIAFIGRSNVGKSSLINSLTHNKSLARTSRHPGRTQQLNFFAIRDALILVDLPGYGYAHVKKTEIRNWTKTTMHYLYHRPNLMRTCLLIDARRGIQESDQTMMKKLDDFAAPYQIIITKSDKLSAAEITSLTNTVLASLTNYSAAHPNIMVTSSKNNSNIMALQTELTQCIQRNQA